MKHGIITVKDKYAASGKQTYSFIASPAKSIALDEMRTIVNDLRKQGLTVLSTKFVNL